ncbi:MAG: hypothetical protein ACFCUR_20890 [Rhodomicrobiaceae bacterium]
MTFKVVAGTQLRSPKMDKLIRRIMKNTDGDVNAMKAAILHASGQDTEIMEELARQYIDKVWKEEDESGGKNAG